MILPLPSAMMAGIILLLSIICQMSSKLRLSSGSIVLKRFIASAHISILRRSSWASFLDRLLVTNSETATISNETAKYIYLLKPLLNIVRREFF